MWKATGLVAMTLGFGAVFAAPPEQQPPALATCLLCHDVSPDGTSLVGPPLWGINGRKVGSVPGFSYSSAMIKYGVTWNREALIAFLSSPQAVVPGTKMAFAGENDPKVTAQLADYLLSLQ